MNEDESWHGTSLKWVKPSPVTPGIWPAGEVSFRRHIRIA